MYVCTRAKLENPVCDGGPGMNPLLRVCSNYCRPQIICLVCQNPLCSLFKYICIKSKKILVCPNQYGAFSESVHINLLLSLSIWSVASLTHFTNVTFRNRNPN